MLKDRSEYVVLDPSVAADVEAIRALHPGDPVFTGADDADATWLVAFTNDSGPIPFFAYDRATGKGHFLFESRPELSRYELAPMEPFSFTARDGLTVHGYATFPPGAERTGLPTVLNVHGGPWARDSWGFDPEAQWLANRGYLCVQVNYRGSTGYGKAFVNAGDREWGGKMQDDLTDAVAFITGQGWADPSRVAIYGGSYGGYAALAGATFTPDLYCCAVDIVGPSNLKTLIETIPPYWAPMIAQFHRRVGDPAKDADFLWSRSPLSRASSIRIPLLIAQGANDPRVKQAESEQIVAALQDSRDRLRVHAVPRRGPWLREAGEPAALLRRRREVPGPPPGRPRRRLRPSGIRRQAASKAMGTAAGLPRVRCPSWVAPVGYAPGIGWTPARSSRVTRTMVIVTISASSMIPADTTNPRENPTDSA